MKLSKISVLFLMWQISLPWHVYRFAELMPVLDSKCELSVLLTLLMFPSCFSFYLLPGKLILLWSCRSIFPLNPTYNYGNLTKTYIVPLLKITLWQNLFFFFPLVLEFELKAFTLRHSTSPSFVIGFLR
jgi:hypothetical protein